MSDMLELGSWRRSWVYVLRRCVGPCLYVPRAWHRQTSYRAATDACITVSHVMVHALFSEDDHFAQPTVIAAVLTATCHVLIDYGLKPDLIP